MADNRTDSFVFYKTYFDSIMKLKQPNEQIELLKCICLYAFDGVIPESDIYYINSIFEAHRVNIDNSIKRREQNIENGKKGGAPFGNQNARKQPNSTGNNRTVFENNLNVNVNADVDVNSDADEYADGNLYEDRDENLNEDEKTDGIAKGRETRKGKVTNRDISILRTSELESIFPKEDINFISNYYTELKRNGFISTITDSKINSINDMRNDLKQYKRSKNV